MTKLARLPLYPTRQVDWLIAMSLQHISCALSVLLAIVTATTAWAVLAEEQREFIANHCIDCHQGSGAEAGLDLSKLEREWLAGKSTAEIAGGDFDTWVKVFDRVAAGEMPPPDAEVVPEAELKQFLASTEKWLTDFQRDEFQQSGRVRGRRLTNLQLERTLQDLLGIDIPLASEMPDEPKTGAFTTLAERQSISHFQLEQHLKIVDLALDEAFRRALSTGDERRERFTAKQLSRTRSRTREPELIDGGAVVWSGGVTYYGRMPATTAPVSGWYRFTFLASALKPPQDSGVWCTVRSGACVSSAPLLDWIGAFEATESPREVSFVAWVPAGHMLEIRPGDAELRKAKFSGGQIDTGLGETQGVSGVKVDWLQMERIHIGPSDADVRTKVLGDVVLGDTAFKPHRDPNQTKLVVKRPRRAGHQLIQQFAELAFRRSPESEQLAAFNDIFDASLKVNADFVTALRAAYRTILCSARFLYFSEQPGQLDDFAIANRLSYLLWNSMPDAELFALAKSEQLRNGSVLKAQVERMLATENGKRFVPDFASQWLELSEIDFTDPDGKLHPDFDSIVQYSMLDETHHYLQSLLDDNTSVAAFVDSDFTFVNSRLARFYDLEEFQPIRLDGDTVQRVSLKEADHRGGLLAQGAILKVTANGTNTSPVVRGVWVSDRILGEPIPPPPSSVPAIEPDIRGAKTIREQLEKHRSHDECAVCHRQIDPPGFALESFDASGKWREFYPRIEKGDRKTGAKVDPSYVTAEGKAFAGFEEFCQLQAANPRPIARGLAEKLLAYGTGGEIEFADRRGVERIVAQAAQDNYGMRSIVHAVVTSDIFLSK